VPIDHLITPRTVIKIDGEGMPIISVAEAVATPSHLEPVPVVAVDPLDPPKRGDMYVKFDITFPKKLTEAQR
jgi:hypothetical protein